MTLHAIETIDPLVLRDGRPNDGRSESRTVSFPLPSTLCGAIRTRLGRRGGVFDASLVPRLLEGVSLRGPLLAHGDQWVVPAPRDALVMKGDAGLSLHPLRPISLPHGAETSPLGAGLHLVGLPSHEQPKGKPFTGPAFWAFESLAAWLRSAETLDDRGARRLLAGSITGLVREERVHVGMGPQGTAEDGKLFSTEGLRLVGRCFDDAAKGDEGPTVDLRLVVDVEVDPSLGELTEGVFPLGGERRLTRWQRSGPAWPAVPAWLEQHVTAGPSAVVRVVMLTPACFEGSVPARWASSGGVATVVAARVDRPQTISGWDMAGKGQGGAPKATRRLVAAGSVYWVRLVGSPEERLAWLQATWLTNVGDDRGMTRDGFGLAIVGIGSEP